MAHDSQAYIQSRKLYAIDTDIVNANFHLSYFREKGECDFVVFEKGRCKLVIQVCQQVHNENKTRKTQRLLEAMDFFDLNTGLIITKNQRDVLRFDKKIIELRPLHEFLM